MLTNLDLGSCAMKILDVINIVIPLRKTVSLMSQRDITIISTASLTSEIYRGYYTVARRYEFYFRVAKQYFTNENNERV